MKWFRLYNGFEKFQDVFWVGFRTVQTEMHTLFQE